MSKPLLTLLTLTALLIALGSFALVSRAKTARPATLTLLNASYDPTVELYAALNPAFARHYQATTGQPLEVKTSHGGSGKQTQAVLAGLEVDVVTLAMAYDVDALAAKGLLPTNWQQRLPDNSAPYTSTIVFVVRPGNPKHIRDWNDLVADGVGIITPDPRSSGGARWNYLAAWAYARHSLGTDQAAQAFVSKLYQNVKVLDAGARGATRTFQRGEGDVLIAWENEALLLAAQGQGYEVIVPSLSILAEPPVAVIDSHAQRRGTTKVAEAYLQFLYTPEAQELIAQNYHRPRSPEVLARHGDRFKTTHLVTVDAEFGGWQKAHAAHFGPGGTFEQIMKTAQTR